MLERFDFLFLKKEDGRKTMIFVWMAWITMILAALACVTQYGKNIPLCEDWLLVAPLTGNEPDLIGWLWEQNNEHRTPLLLLILLGLLAVFKDFRAGMYFNVLILGCLSFSLVRVTCHLRGRASFADAFFPVSLLHLGNWENITFSWQVHFVVPFALICCVLILIACDSAFTLGWTTVAVGICLLLFPLCGGIGLLWTPGLALWLLYCSCFQVLLAKDKTDLIVEKTWKRQFLFGSAILALAVSAVYFIGYEKPNWNPPSPGLGETFKTIAKFISLGFGPSVARFWGLSVLIAFGFLLSTIVLVSLAFFRNRRLKRHQALGLLLFLANACLFSFAMGWSRAGLVITLGGLPPRYVHLSLLTFLAVFFIWEIYGKPIYSSAVQHALIIVVLCLLPLNTWVGFQEWGSWYRQGMRSFESEMGSGMSYELLAKHHKDFLIPWWDTEQLIANMRMLDDADIGPFANRERTLSLPDR